MTVGDHIMDTCFDSGSSHAAVCKTRPELAWPADMYLEGSDQHRGWFQSSLLTSVATEGKAPYRAVLTHGYVVDGEGRKMSKSVGNTGAAGFLFTFACFSLIPTAGGGTPARRYSAGGGGQLF